MTKGQECSSGIPFVWRLASTPPKPWPLPSCCPRPGPRPAAGPMATPASGWPPGPRARWRPRRPGWRPRTTSPRPGSPTRPSGTSSGPARGAGGPDQPVQSVRHAAGHVRPGGCRRLGGRPVHSARHQSSGHLRREHVGHHRARRLRRQRPGGKSVPAADRSRGQPVRQRTHGTGDLSQRRAAGELRLRPRRLRRSNRPPAFTTPASTGIPRRG